MEPAGALIRAGGVAGFAQRHRLGPVSEGIAYLTGDEAPASAFATSFRVREVLPLRAKDVDAYLADVRPSRIDIKKRGTDVEPAAFRKKLKRARAAASPAGPPVTVILTRLEGHHRALVAEAGEIAG